MNKTILIIVVIVCVVLAVWFFSKNNNRSAMITASPSPTPTPTISLMPSIQQTPGLVMVLAGGLKVQDLVVGTGAGAKNGQTLSVHYTGTLENGKKFDSSVDRGTPFSFTLGVGQVIEGWDKGVLGMKVGGKRKLIIPSSLGYGVTGAGNMIPPNATLIFEVELLTVN